MPDWIEILRRRMGALGLEPRREAEILTELAHHHRDLFDEWRSRGLSEEEATARALGEVSDWQELRREIRGAELEEEPMNHRTRRIWLPGLVTGTLSMGLLWSLESLGFHMRIFWRTQTPPGLIFSLPWLLVLPFVGALGAYICARAGGGPQERLFAGLFPSAALTVLFMATVPVALIVQSHVSHVPWALVFSGIASVLLGWVIIPGAALLVGVLPFVVASRQEPSSSHAGA